MNIRRKQAGLSVVEFTIVSTVLLILLFAIIEIGRFLFSLQMLNDLTRKAARLASVCFIVDESLLDTEKILGSAFDSTPINLDSLELSIDYLDESGGEVSSPTSESGFSQIKYVRAEISGFSFAFSTLASVFGSTTNVNAFETVLPAESLGVYRPYYENGGGYVSDPDKVNCQGSAP
ncbi:TadE/TadG family type IV pilus assembly protein [Vibrio breoganii]|uniref:TadE/TadG family type IV pilus assembly protein n=1 Tax=Vibrio breoganii TaxID=553239 RepID=UPI000C8675D8|nr:TadE family protein [Vibrio breoganii]PMG05640.1 hypothetical protein BCV00_12615 [Vibrio breoganii]PMI17890.1 hypothetical protein BCU49_13015 [Vibrio breoganii]